MAAVAAAVAVLLRSLFYPVDVIKSAMMTDRIDPAKRRQGASRRRRAAHKAGGHQTSVCRLSAVPWRRPRTGHAEVLVDKIKQMLG